MYNHRDYGCRKPKGKLKMTVPRWRLEPGILGCALFAVGMLWLGWTGYQPELSVFLPMAAGIIIGIASVLIFRAFNVRLFIVLLKPASNELKCFIQTYLIDVYKRYSASALAASVICRSLLAGILPLFTDASMFFLI